MNTDTSVELGRLFDQWSAEDERLTVCIDEIRDWMTEVNQLGIPHFGETASRLEPVREFLDSQFAHENALLDRLGQAFSDDIPEIKSFSRQARSDHQTLLAWLADLTSRLTEIDPPFESWTSAMEEVDVLFERIEQHERDENDRFRMLLPPESVQ